jgi:hypothetical protein
LRVYIVHEKGFTHRYLRPLHISSWCQMSPVVARSSVVL